MSHIHTFTRPDVITDPRQVGAVYSSAHTTYDEGARFTYRDGAYDLVLFWSRPTQGETEGFRAQPVDLALYGHGPAGFLLYKMKDVCEWSDVAFNVHLVPEAERQLPDEPAGERARLILILVDASDGIIRARRLVSLDKVMTQALKHQMRAQAAQPFVQAFYDAAVQETYARFADSDALAQAAEVLEPALG
jgi:hypothetical protein